MRFGEPWIAAQRLAQLVLREVLELEAVHHLAVEEVRGGGAGRDVKHARERVARFRRRTRLRVRHPERIRDLRLARQQATDFLEVRDRFRDVTREVMRKPEDLHRFAPLG